MNDLDAIEQVGRQLVVRHGDSELALRRAVDLGFMHVLECIRLEHAPDTPGAIPEHQRAAVYRQWAAANDLPSFKDAQRLAYLLDRYRTALTYDLRHYAQVDLVEFWQARRWRTLIDIIDRLPGHSWYSTAVYGDEEHAKMLADSLAARKAEEGDDEKKGPGLQTWTPEVAAITALHDTMRNVLYVLEATNGAKVQPPRALPRPYSPLEAALKRSEMARRQASHDSLVARLLPHKSRS